MQEIPRGRKMLWVRVPRWEEGHGLERLWPRYSHGIVFGTVESRHPPDTDRSGPSDNVIIVLSLTSKDLPIFQELVSKFSPFETSLLSWPIWMRASSLSFHLIPRCPGNNYWFSSVQRWLQFKESWVLIQFAQDHISTSNVITKGASFLISIG